MNVETLEKSLLEHKDPDKILAELDRLDAEESLRGFVDVMWSVLEPGRKFSSGWHIDAICEHLEAVTRGDIIRLLINVPPGCMKSLTTNVFWPAWEWGPRNRPDLRYVGASYSEALTIRDNRRTRALIKSPRYQQLWGDRFTIIPEQDSKMRFDSDKTGFKIATSVSGLGTGERGDRFIIDDPHNVKDGESDAVRKSTLLWFQETVPTRVNDPEKSAIVVIMQRVHELDVSGHIISKELGYEHLMLPMEYEPERHCSTKIGFSDPREDDNELIWPQRMSREVVERWKKEMGSYAVAGQFQQRPSPRGGGMFKQEWFEVVDPEEVPKKAKAVRGWDLAATEKETAAWTAGVKISRFGRTFYIEDVVRLRGSPNKVEAAIVNTASKDTAQTKISIPQDPGQAGVSQKKYLASALIGYPVSFSRESGSKELRAEALASQAEAGNVKIVRGAWNGDFFEEITKFPSSTYKDQVDAASRAFAELVVIKKGGIPTAGEVINLRG